MAGPHYRLAQIGDAEVRFAQHVAQFFKNVHPAEQRAVQFICRSWAKSWGSLDPGFQLPAGNGLAALQEQVTRAYWRDTYHRNRATILAQKARRYQPRPKQLGQCEWCQAEFLKKYCHTRFCSQKCRRAEYYYNHERGRTHELATGKTRTRSPAQSPS
jgi:hypothetical protein